MKSHLHWAATAFLVVASSVLSVDKTASVSGQGSWESTLQARDLDGNLSTSEAYYDTALNITWPANANLAANNTFGLRIVHLQVQQLPGGQI